MKTSLLSDTFKYKFAGLFLCFLSSFNNFITKLLSGKRQLLTIKNTGKEDGLDDITSLWGISYVLWIVVGYTKTIRCLSFH